MHEPNKNVLCVKFKAVYLMKHIQYPFVGLKAFSGLKHMDLFKNDNDNNDAKCVATSSIVNKKVVATSCSKVDKKNVAPSSKVGDVKNTIEESDSDSDYEYFKVQKELELKKIAAVESDVEIKPSKVANTFVEALKTAIVEDELVLPATVNQTFLIIPMKLRLVTLCSLIVEHCVLNKKGGKMIIFMATLEMVEYHSDLIETVLTKKEVKVKKKDKGKKRTSKPKKRKTDGIASEEVNI